MKSFATDRIGRFVVIHLEKGDLLLESIQSETERLSIKSGVVISGIGSLRKIVLHIITNTKDVSVNEYITIEEPIEIGSIQGIILDGVAHLHIVCSDMTRAYTGHLENGCEVQYIAEISILEVEDMGLTRKNDQFGVTSNIDYR